jgi:hypothetical protein
MLCSSGGTLQSAIYVRIESYSIMSFLIYERMLALNYHIRNAKLGEDVVENMLSNPLAIAALGRWNCHNRRYYSVVIGNG